MQLFFEFVYTLKILKYFLDKKYITSTLKSIYMFRNVTYAM